MTDEIKTADRDEVLFAFHQECERPSAEQIVAWVNRFPQFAEDIRAHAAVAWDWATQTVDSEVEVDETISARAYSQALNIIYSAEHSDTPAKMQVACRTFQQMQTAVGKETYQTCKMQLDVGREVLSPIYSMVGCCHPFAIVSSMVVRSLLGHFQTRNSTPHWILRWTHLIWATRSPIDTPVVKARPCDDIIRDSNMSPERKRYWLEED